MVSQNAAPEVKPTAAKEADEISDMSKSDSHGDDDELDE